MELIFILGAAFVSFLIFTLMVKVIRATVRTAIWVALILLGLQLFFGIGPGRIWEAIAPLLPQYESTR